MLQLLEIFTKKIHQSNSLLRSLPLKNSIPSQSLFNETSLPEGAKVAKGNKTPQRSRKELENTQRKTDLMKAKWFEILSSKWDHSFWSMFPLTNRFFSFRSPDKSKKSSFRRPFNKAF